LSDAFLSLLQIARSHGRKYNGAANEKFPTSVSEQDCGAPYRRRG
jgi:hypothetical protein